ncbi:MAG: hypothetical protein U0271_21195 [Polyangiaceae bacterium]
MFEVFEVVVPKLLQNAEVTVRAIETAFGRDETLTVHVGSLRLGPARPAHIAFSDVEHWAGSRERAHWTVVSVHTLANAAAGQDSSWAEFLSALRVLLELHPKWRISCESDCDQYPRTSLSLTVGAVLELLDAYRASPQTPIAVTCESPDSAATFER